MTKAAGEILPGNPVATRPPGFLLVPFGWAAEWLALMIESEPALAADVFHLGRRRMHLIALAFAHFDGEAPPRSGPTHIGRILLRGYAEEILDATLSRRPPGLARALDRLPPWVMEPDSYRDPASAKLLHHADEINDSTIKLLKEIPAALRPAVLAIHGCSRSMDGLADGLRFLVSRGIAPSFEALIAELASAGQPAQMIAKLRRVAGALPLPDAMPPAQVGHASRVDRGADIRALAKRWRNCLEIYLSDVDRGLCAVYRWDDGEPVACMIRRRGRFGWFFTEAKGPDNAAVAPARLQHIHRAFADAGIPQSSAIDALEHIVEDAGWRRRRHRPRAAQDETIEPDVSLDLDAA